jgi:endogenous inhibitor of DNA gyrase (YacG/DUF329 family)
MREEGAQRGAVTKKPIRCPICGRPRDPAHRPFCSARCRDVDLARWFNQVYSIPAAEPDERPDPEGDESEQP